MHVFCVCLLKSTAECRGRRREISLHFDERVYVAAVLRLKCDFLKSDVCVLCLLAEIKGRMRWVKA